MAERVQQSAQPVASETAEVDLRRLPHLISGARASSGGDRRALAGEINKILFAMRKPGYAEEETKLIVTALDGHAFDDLVDEAGASCRKEAVETLLASGFPHALNVAPEDLQFARTYVAATDDGASTWDEQVRRNRRNGAAVVDGAQFLFLLILVFSGQRIGTGELVALMGGLGAMVTATLFASRPATPESQAAWGTVLALCGAAQMLAALDVGAPALLGAVGTVFGLLMALPARQPRADPPKPGDWDYRDPS